jgi:hypothetical protein
MRIIKGVFRHWRNGEGQLNVNDILQVDVVLIKLPQISEFSAFLIKVDCQLY